MHQENPSAPIKLALAERRYQAFQLRKQGGTFRQIAATMRQVDGVSENYNEAQAYRDVMAFLTTQNKQYALEAEPMRRMLLEQYQEIVQKLWPMVVRTGDLFALDRLMGVLDRIARLTGADAPIRVASQVAVAGQVAVQHSGQVGVSNDYELPADQVAEIVRALADAGVLLPELSAAGDAQDDAGVLSALADPAPGGVPAP